MGVQRGWPDFTLFDPTGRLHALELKREGETLTDDQEDFQIWCIARGVPHSVSRSVDEALMVLDAWGVLRVKIGGKDDGAPPSRTSGTSTSRIRFDRLPSVRWSEFDRFLKSGVPARALVYPELPARARVVLFPDRPLFDFADDMGGDGAAPAFVFVARDEFGDACDLVAWAPSEARVAAWLGRASMLGLESLWAPRIMYDGALVVHETPREWLRSERQGVVVVEPRRAAPLLREAEHLCASTAEHGFYLQSLLALRPPRIVVPKASLRRAA